MLIFSFEMIDQLISFPCWLLQCKINWHFSLVNFYFYWSRVTVVYHCTTSITSTTLWCLLQKVLWTGSNKSSFGSMKTRMNSCLSYINSFSSTLMSFAIMEERIKLSWVSEFYVLCVTVLALLTSMKIAMIQRCHLQYQRRNGEKDPRFYIFP